VEVGTRTPSSQAIPATFASAIQHLGIHTLTSCEAQRIYFLQGTLNTDEIQRLTDAVLADPVTEEAHIIALSTTGSTSNTQVDRPAEGHHHIDITLLPGVTDPAAENLLRAAHLIGVDGLARAASGQRYRLSGDVSAAALHQLAVEVFSNPVIQRFAIDQAIAPPFIPYQASNDTVEVIALRDASDMALLDISTTRRLALDLAEMQAIRAYYQREGRDPSDVELEMLAQTWSEHCVHKTFRAVIDFQNKADASGMESMPPQMIDGLLRTYIRAATERVNKPWVRSAFVDNAGIVAFNDNWDLAFKVETHNHPSALEPFGGANTGVGGVIRDILGVSARPIANTDVLCFGPPDLPYEQLPAGVLHPTRVADGVIHGVEDYGNKMGIPTVNGAILYHPGYTANPLVFCGCLGILPRDSHPSNPQPGDLIIVIGGRTGRDGLRGATFSSMEMDTATSDVAGSAVQIGHPIHEKQAMEAVLQARDERLYHALTDCGAGGLSSAVGELGRQLGVRVQLDMAPLKYPGLRPWEIWLSEAQERMVLAVAPGHWPRLQEICAGLNIEAVCIGAFEADTHLRLFYGTQQVADLDMHFLHDGIPRRHLNALYEPGHLATAAEPAQQADSVPLQNALLALLSHPDICSKESVIRRYDHEVQGGTAIKPLVGVANHGPSDAAVLVPVNDVSAGTDNPQTDTRGVALSVGICPSYTELDPYAMAWAAVDEAMRNAVAVGADPDQVSLLDNFCWGNPNLPDRLGSLVHCAQGCYDAAIAYNAPFISGKDSLNNEYSVGDGRKHAIPGTLLISALGIVPDIAHAVSMDLKAAGNLLYVVGETRAELGGSHYQMLSSTHVPAGESHPPQPVPHALDAMRALHRAMQAGLVQACHDCSEGGLGVALAEMALAGRLGAEVMLAEIPGASSVERDDCLLFSESLARFIVEVRPHDAAAFEAALASQSCARVGQVLADGKLRLHTRQTATVTLSVSALEIAWRGSSAATATHAPQRTTERHLLPQVASIKRRPHILVLHATGTNRDHDAALACEQAGGDAEIVHINQLISAERHLLDYAMLVAPGGFSYGDDLGAGTLWALDMSLRLGESMARFVSEGRLVLGVCNGFQALVKAGLLPGADSANDGLVQVSQRPVTLAPNESAHFECRWVYLQAQRNSTCVFTAGMDELIYCPVAHGEGRVAARDTAALRDLQARGLIALTYVNAQSETAEYPDNPNGSALNIAGLTNAQGNVLGLMPHPENHIFPWQHPRHTRGERGMDGLRLFANGIKQL
jgi:phosphoribosylformylglycinamidine synthase